MTWEEFRESSEELAELGEKRFNADGVVLVGTLRKNGYPRISPVEALFHKGQLYLGMMWQSRKALDLIRDPRCTVHSGKADRHLKDCDFKVFGKAIDVQNKRERKSYCNALQQKIGWSPDGMKFHLFKIDVESAAAVTSERDALYIRVWSAAKPTIVRTKRATME